MGISDTNLQKKGCVIEKSVQKVFLKRNIS